MSFSRMIMKFRSSDSENSMNEFETVPINQSSSNKSDSDQAAERESGPRYAADPLAQNQGRFIFKNSLYFVESKLF